MVQQVNPVVHCSRVMENNLELGLLHGGLSGPLMEDPWRDSFSLLQKWQCWTLLNSKRRAQETGLYVWLKGRVSLVFPRVDSSHRDG